MGYRVRDGGKGVRDEGKGSRDQGKRERVEGMTKQVCKEVVVRCLEDKREPGESRLWVGELSLAFFVEYCPQKASGRQMSVCI